MSDSSSLIESLLYQNEGTALDFKREQYPFIGATDEQKAELLKDILAFANSWRQSDAYIVIAVEAVQGGKHIPVGTDEHFDDAQLQQFVNCKTNRKVELSYEIHLFEGKRIGVIKIPKQERPTYANKKFGKVDKDVVYYRLGSSTAIANPEDIARMGKETAQSVLVPSMNLQFADYETRQELGDSIKLFSTAYEKPRKPLPDAGQARGSGISGFIAPTSIGEMINSHYWRDKEEYIRLKSLAKPVTLVISNKSRTLAEKVRVEIIGSSLDGITVLRDLPTEPAYRHIESFSRNVPRIRSVFQQEPRTVVSYHGNQWTLTVSFGNVQPQSRVWADEPFYIGSKQKDRLEMEAIIYADNLPEPQKVKFAIDFEIEKKLTLTIDTLKTLPPFER